MKNKNHQVFLYYVIFKFLPFERLINLKIKSYNEIDNEANNTPPPQKKKKR